MVVVADVRLPQHGGMDLQRTDSTTDPHHRGLKRLGTGTADHHTPHETAQQGFFLFGRQKALPPQLGQRPSQIPQWRLPLRRNAWGWRLTRASLGGLTRFFDSL